MAPTIISVRYPMGSKFNMDYYLSVHLPLIKKNWGPFGLKGWKVAEYSGSEDPWCVVGWFEFEGPDHWAKAASSDEGKEVFGDIPNFTDKGATTLTGSVVLETRVVVAAAEEVLVAEPERARVRKQRQQWKQHVFVHALRDSSQRSQISRAQAPL
ncbi:hypothetical protein GGR52DRAFT_569600 [Hypoxylon sp. FL1284]|nr:hypothetical protein GGR52DRAFT_569600 [Hypoxylon sp. FL1284]